MLQEHGAFEFYPSRRILTGLLKKEVHGICHQELALWGTYVQNMSFVKNQLHIEKAFMSFHLKYTLLIISIKPPPLS
jgi:hypothetical protein